MKKLFSFIALAALLILPIKVSAESTLSWEVSDADASGQYTVKVYMTVAKDTIYDGFNATITGQHAFIKETSGSDTFLKVEESSTIDPTQTSATLVTRPATPYTGTGEKIEVASFKYAHDTSYTGEEECKITINPVGGTEVIVTEKKPSNNPKTGNALPYIGIIGGLVLIGAAYVISKRSSKLYKM